MKKVLTNHYFILLCIALSVLYYIISGISYWISDYFLEVYKKDQTTVYITYGIVSITGPVFGIIVGGSITTKLGGYKAKKSLIVT